MRIQVSCAMAVLPLIASCLSRPPVITDAVGPAPPVQRPAQGYLKVFSATGERYDEGLYYPHTPYLIYGSNSKLFRRVGNGYEANNAEPDLVTLPIGTYTVEAEAYEYPLVRVPVVIEEDRLTTVTLDHRREKAPTNTLGADQVQLPNGRVVGWRSGQSAMK